MGMYAAPSLFDAPVTAGTARKADRWTSIAAARAKDPGPDQQRCLDALRANGGRGTIDTVCVAVTDRDRGCLSRRLTDLEQGGYIADSGETELGSRGRHVTVWIVR
jgi:hypothetical protein